MAAATSSAAAAPLDFAVAWGSRWEGLVMPDWLFSGVEVPPVTVIDAISDSLAEALRVPLRVDSSCSGLVLLGRGVLIL